MHILLAVDGSEGARLATRELAQLPFPAGTRLTVLHVPTRYVPSAKHGLPQSVVNALKADEDERIQDILKDARALLTDTNFSVEVTVVEGHPARQVTETAVGIGADLIVIGVLGMSGWMRALLGSTSLTVVKHAPCPVWVVKRPRKKRRFDVLLATDGSRNSRHALKFCAALPLPAGTVAHLIHVTPALNEQLHLTGTEIDPPVLAPLYEVGKHLQEQGRALLDHESEMLSHAFAEVRPFIVEGEVRHKILEAADDVEADLLVLGSKGRSGIEEFFLGSVSHKVLKHAPCSVLVVPPATS